MLQQNNAPFLMRSSHCWWGSIMSPQSLTVCQRSLTTMQIQVQGLLQFSAPFFPTAQVITPHPWLLGRGLSHPAVVSGRLMDCLSFPQRDLLGIQRLLNSTEFNVHQLSALLDCRGLHKVGPPSERGAFFFLKKRAVFAAWGNKTLNLMRVSLCGSQTDVVRLNCQRARRLH